MTKHMWKLFGETYIFLQVMVIADITTACGCYFMETAILVTPSYPSIFQWPQQQHNITSQHELLFN